MNMWTLFYTLLIWASSSSARILNINSNKSYTAMWAIQLHSSAKDDDAQFIANTLGLTYQKILPNNYYLLTDKLNQDLLDKPNEEITGVLKSFSKVIWVEQQAVEHFESRTEFSDPLWNSQYYLKSSPPGFKISQHIDDVWAKGYNGKGVTVVVIDDGVRGTHRELRNRYDNIVSAIIATGSSQTSGHGTQCAGVIAAEANNSLCGVGVAYGCNIAGIKLFAGNSATDADEAQAFYRDHINPSMIDIFSNSWGPSDNGYTIRGPGRLAAEAFKHGIEKGRHNSGSIYVFSCGNGAHVDDSCAFDGYVNSIYTIPVASITKDGKVTGFSERCSAVMTAVYSSEMVTISGKDDNQCVSDFGRTSAAAAFVSGILALALEANANITWRDMQHLIARSSNWINVDAAVKRVTNAKNFTVNENFGFGVLDASALINNAKKWKDSVPGQVVCTLNVTAELGTQTIPTTLNMNIAKDNLNCESKLINSLEHVQLKVDLDYTNRAVLVIDIESMSGTSSRFLYPRQYDSIGNPRTYNNLVVTSVHFWGEPLLGRWTVDIKEGTGIHAIQGTGTLFDLSLIFYGTVESLDDNDNKTGHNNNTPTVVVTDEQRSTTHVPATATEASTTDAQSEVVVTDEQRSTTHVPTTATETSTTDAQSEDPSASSSGAIIGASIAAFFVLPGIGGGVYLLKRRLNHSAQNDVPRQDGHELSQSSNTLASAYENKVMV